MVMRPLVALACEFVVLDFAKADPIGSAAPGSVAPSLAATLGSMRGLCEQPETTGSRSR